MTHIQHFIQDARDGGHSFAISDLEILVILLGDQHMEAKNMVLSSILLNPDVWKAVGKKRGWPDESYTGRYSDYLEGSWKARMLGLVEARIIGKPIEDYLEELP